MDNPPELTVLSLCTGYGGLELGLARALANPLRVVAVEVEAYALANLAAKAEAGALAIEALWPDLRTFPAERFRGCFDFVLAGYPCQPFSLAGRRAGATEARHLWPDIERIVRAVEPVWCFFENVAGHLSLGFPAVYRSLRSMGYAVEAGLFTAAECCAPHRRQRLFILAHHPGDGRPAWRAEPEGEQGRTNAAGGGDDVPDAENPDRGHREQSRQIGKGQRRRGPGVNSGAMADSDGLRVQRAEPAGAALSLRLADEHGRTLWPMPPGPRQYEWEEPRTESRLGRATDGSAGRVDRLRLLGNGVVPQQAELALRTLLRQWPGEV